MIPEEYIDKLLSKDDSDFEFATAMILGNTKLTAYELADLIFDLYEKHNLIDYAIVTNNHSDTILRVPDDLRLGNLQNFQTSTHIDEFTVESFEKAVKEYLENK